MAERYYISASKQGKTKRLYMGRSGKPTIWRILAKRGSFVRADWPVLKAYQQSSGAKLQVEKIVGEPDPTYKYEYEELLDEAASFGLSIQGDFQTTGGNHAPNSYHYSKQAIDIGDATNSLTDMRRWQGHAYRNPSKFVEFFFDQPHPTYGYFFIKNGQIIRGKFGGHSDHIHAARVW